MKHKNLHQSYWRFSTCTCGPMGISLCPSLQWHTMHTNSFDSLFSNLLNGSLLPSEKHMYTSWGRKVGSPHFQLCSIYRKAQVQITAEEIEFACKLQISFKFQEGWIAFGVDSWLSWSAWDIRSKICAPEARRCCSSPCSRFDLVFLSILYLIIISYDIWNLTTCTLYTIQPIVYFSPWIISTNRDQLNTLVYILNCILHTCLCLSVYIKVTCTTLYTYIAHQSLQLQSRLVPALCSVVYDVVCLMASIVSILLKTASLLPI